MFQPSAMPEHGFLDAEHEASHETNPTRNFIARDDKTLSIGELHLSGKTLNPCFKALNCNVSAPIVPSGTVSVTQNTEDRVSHTIDKTVTMTVNMTEFAAQNDDDNFSDIDSLRGDSSLVSVRGYRVKPENLSFLTSILSKHGDIGENCSLGSVSVRSLFMEQLCDILQKLTNTSIGVITENELEEMRASVNDIGNASVEVEWLKIRLDEISEAKKAIPNLKPNSSLKLKNAEHKKRLGKMKEQLEGYKKDFAVKHAEALDLRNKIQAAQSDISATEKEVVETEKVISEGRTKLKKVYELGSLVNGLI
ncbi:hypothetical protein RND81_02G141300 [Saponaria officinalis]|uniref:Uncharacterized protein n=1 Tax=Saponaria officinalis TaxID=3572 RepID=A0AAW1MT01_SAPOF